MGTGFGNRPSTNTGDALLDAFVWVKPGGECDVGYPRSFLVTKLIFFAREHPTHPLLVTMLTVVSPTHSSLPQKPEHGSKLTSPSSLPMPTQASNRYDIEHGSSFHTRLGHHPKYSVKALDLLYPSFIFPTLYIVLFE